MQNETILAAGHVLFCAQYANIDDEHPNVITYGAGDELTEVIDPATESDVMRITSNMIGRIEQSCGYSVGVLFYHMGLDDSQHERALTDLLLGAVGHGVCLVDRFAKQLKRAESILGQLPDIYLDDSEFHELAFCLYHERNALECC